MQRLLMLTMLFGAVAQQDKTECGVARKHKKELTNIFCTGGSTDAASCDAACCEDDKLTCGGSGVVCPFDQYAPVSDAWKATPTTDKTKVKDCCLPKVACQNQFYTCPAGMKSKGAAVASVKCPGGPSTCAGTVCCENDDTTCGGANNGAGWTCDTGLNSGSKDNAWKAIKNAAGTMTEAEFKKNTHCCTANPTCSSGTCPAGFKATAGKENTACAGAACDLADADKGTCCEADASTCAGTPPTCAAGTYYPSTEADWQNKPKDQCCTAVATCADATCPAGYKAKKDSAKTQCTGDADSCVAGTDCCEKDVNTCGGLTGISCAYGFFDASTTWTSKTPKAVKDAWKLRVANETNKNENCCDKRAKCSEVDIGTTTPAATKPAATTTPAIPIRRYSEHKIAVQKSSGANMLWLGAGAMIGMAALMVVQVVRTRIQSSSEEEDAREVGDLLLEEASVE